jgi:23S rRNA pseudouridine1911/1915/1917 synthase
VVVTTDGTGPTYSSSYRILERGKTCDLIEISASPAYRHQVRIHLAEAGAPLLGDLLYGGLPHPDLDGHALHASYIAGAATGVPAFEAESKVPDGWGALLDG